MYEIKAEVRAHHTHSAATTRVEFVDTERKLELTIIMPKEDAVNWPVGYGTTITLGVSTPKPKKKGGEEQ